MSKRIRALFLSYDGLTDPLGQSQVLAYLIPMSRRGIYFDIISFEKPANYSRNKPLIEALIKDTSITWHPLPYHKNPPVLSTVYDIQRGRQLAERLIKKNAHQIVHARGYVTALIAEAMKKRFPVKFLFDMRGWWADEKKESGLWNAPLYKPIYQWFKKKERDFFSGSDLAVSLTHAGKEEILRLGLKDEKDIAVIPTCVDLDIFKPFSEEIREAVRKQLDIPLTGFVLIYAGALGGYYRTDVILDIFKTLLRLREDSHLILLTRVDHEYVRQEIRKSQAPAGRIRLLASEFRDVHRYLIASDAGLVIYNPTYSSIGRSPTKLGEYWACGLPVLTLQGVGDLDYLFSRYPEGGVQIPRFEESAYTPALSRLLSKTPDRTLLRAYATDYFNVAKGVGRYCQIYERLTSG